MTEQEAIYTAMMETIITLTKAAKATGKFTAEEIWENLKAEIMKMTGLPESVAAYLIRSAWEQASKETETMSQAILTAKATKISPSNHDVKINGSDEIYITTTHLFPSMQSFAEYICKETNKSHCRFSLTEGQTTRTITI